MLVGKLTWTAKTHLFLYEWEMIEMEDAVSSHYDATVKSLCDVVDAQRGTVNGWLTIYRLFECYKAGKGREADVDTLSLLCKALEPCSDSELKRSLNRCLKGLLDVIQKQNELDSVGWLDPDGYAIQKMIAASARQRA